MCSLTGEASNILKDLPENPSYKDVVACLRQHHGSVDQVEAYRAQLKNRRRRPGESLQDLMKDIRRIFLSAYPGPTNYMSEIAIKDAFITALVDRDLTIKTMEREPKTLDEAYKVAEQMELYRSIPETSEGDAKSKFQPKVRGTAADDGVLKSLVETQKVIQRQLASLQECVKQPPPQATPSPSERGPRVSRTNIVCHHCQSPGHIRRNCPDLAFRPDSSGGNGNRRVNEGARPSESSRSTDTVRSIGKALYLKVQIGRRKFKGLLDSGSEVPLLPAVAAKGYRLGPSYRVLRAANGSEISVLGSLRLAVRVGSLYLNTDFIVSDQIQEVIFGMDWMNRHRCVLECGFEVIRIRGVPFRLNKRAAEKCNVRGKEVVRNRGVRIHFETAHNPNQRNYPCRFCEKVYGHLDTLTRHVRSRHRNQDPDIGGAINVGAVRENGAFSTPSTPTQD